MGRGGGFNIRHFLILQLGQPVEEEVMIDNRREGSVASPYACEMEKSTSEHKN